MASLASRSANLLRSRGTHSYVTLVKPRAASPAASASGFMSGCLIFQRPDICSTTSRESIRTWTEACGSIRAAARRPAMRPEYSATLLVAMPMYSDSVARTSMVLGVPDQGAVPGWARIAAGAAVGLDDEPAHRGARHRPDSAVRTRIRRHSSQRTTSSGAAARIWFRSTVCSERWHPSQRPRRSIAAPTPCCARSLS